MSTNDTENNTKECIIKKEFNWANKLPSLVGIKLITIIKYSTYIINKTNKFR